MFSRAKLEEKRKKEEEKRLKEEEKVNMLSLNSVWGEKVTAGMEPVPS